jgi:hypothetical protein
METKGHTLRQLHSRHITARKVLSINDNKLGGIVIAIMNEGNNPTVVLVNTSWSSDKDWLSSGATWTVIKHKTLSSVEIMLDGRPMHRS